MSGALSVLLVLLIGALGLLATRSAGHKAIEVHRQDRLQLENLLAGLMAQGTHASLTSLQSLIEGQESGGATRFSAAPDGPRAAEDLARLQAILDKSPTYDAGAAVLNSSGRAVVKWSPTGSFPSITEPGLSSLLSAVMAPGTALPLSGVVDLDGRPGTALGAPVTLADGSPGLFVAGSYLRTSELQKYNEKISADYGVESWMVDHRGLAVTAPDAAKIGMRLPRTSIAKALPSSGSGLLDTEEGGEGWVTVYAEIPGTSWMALATQPRASFQGELEAGSRRAQVAVLLLLLLAGGGMLGMHRRRESALHEVAHTDELTGLLNRRGWFDEAEQELERSVRAGETRTLLFVDLDGLKQVNDVLGHREGDRAIADAASVLRRAARRGDIVGRLGGDEFVVLAAAGTAGPGHRVLETLAAHNETSSAGFDLRFSLGVERWDPADPCSLEELVRRADAVMYVDKTGRPDRRQGVVRLPAQLVVSELVVSEELVG